MALFKLRKKVDEPAAAATPAESVEAMRRRARHRLVGAAVLVLVGVVGFPLLFDTQPRPVPVDIPIEIPDRNKVQPLPSPAPVVQGKVTPEAPASAAAPEAKAPPAAAAPAPAQVAKTEPAPVAKSEPAPEKKPEPAAEPRTETKAAAAKPAAADEAAKARALLEGKSVEAAGVRYVVQVGAFAEKDKAREVQQKLERAGLKNYTNVAETKNGPRIRVRAGPFGSRAEADKAAEKIKGLDLPAAILSL